MDTPSFKEDHISQIPALLLLQKLGYKYLSPAETKKLCSGKTSNVLLDDILRKQLKEINSDKRIKRYKEDLTMFLKLRVAVVERYSDEIDYKQYEWQIQKLIDTHITTDKIEVITEDSKTPI